MIDKESTLKWKKGHDKFNQFMKEERKRKLARLTVEESYSQYKSLCLMWEQTRKHNKGIGSLDKLKIEFLIKRRQIFDQLAGKINEPSG